MLNNNNQTPVALSQGGILPCNEWHKKLGFTDNQLYDCSETQTMSHIVNSCPLTKFDMKQTRRPSTGWQHMAP